MVKRDIAIFGAVLVLVACSTSPDFAQKFRADELQPDGTASQTSWDAVALGRVEPQSREIKIVPPAPAQIADVRVKINEKVFAGELLIRLDDDEALARVAAADAQAALHKRARNDQSTSAAAADRRKAYSVADAERSVADMRSALDKVTVEWRAGHASQADLETARSALSRAQDRVMEQQNGLAKLKISGDTPLPTRVEGELNVARAEWTLAQAALEKTRLRAPIDGTVLQVDARKGELAAPSNQSRIARARRCFGSSRARRARRAVSRASACRPECEDFVLQHFAVVSLPAKFLRSPGLSVRDGSIRADHASSMTSMYWRSWWICQIPDRSSWVSWSTSISAPSRRRPNSYSVRSGPSA